MTCKKCGKEDDLRMGICFDCAHAGEARSAKRTVIQHLMRAVFNLSLGRYLYARYDVTWAWERLTRTGDYKRGGYFEREGHKL